MQRAHRANARRGFQATRTGLRVRSAAARRVAVASSSAVLSTVRERCAARAGQGLRGSDDNARLHIVFFSHHDTYLVVKFWEELAGAFDRLLDELALVGDDEGPGEPPRLAQLVEQREKDDGLARAGGQDRQGGGHLGPGGPDGGDALGLIVSKFGHFRDGDLTEVMLKVNF